jgi:MoaA/NifB/PqqE/SkfB family radical SAM enzyme
MNNKQFVSFYKDYVDSINKYNIDIGYKCPLECPFCVRQSAGGKQKILESSEITLSELETLIKAADHISFCGQISDPIYHSNFLDIIKVLSKYKHKSFSIHTNGTRKKTSWWKDVFAMSKPNIKWTFGLDGADQETANIYRINTRFDEVIEAMKLGASMGVNVEWQFIVFKHNEHQIELAKSIAKDYGINFQILKSNRWFKKELMEKYNIQQPSEQWISNSSQEERIIFINKK